MAPRSDEQFEAMRQQTIDKINGSALKLFSEFGYKNTSVAAIAKEAGISKGLIYNYYKSKEDVLVGVLEGFQKMEEAFTDLPKFTLEEILTQYYLMLEHQQGFLKMMISMSLDVKELPIVQRFIEKKVEKNMKMFVPLFEDLGFEDPKSEAWFLSTLIEGMLILRIVAKQHYPIELVKNEINKRYKINIK
ncbi:MAG: TetR/AcrR family transcriptional regulator [Crocinitomicaceae bacterium]|nr:TetR/AcrR family transcriptional regulator [Crocinitomicaceae bacterium]